MIADNSRPVVALDVDGVIRVIPRLERDRYGMPIGYREPVNTDIAEVTVLEGGELDTLFHHLEAGSFPVYLARGAGAWIRSLLDRGIDVVWATTWMEHANVHIAPLLGIPELPVAVKLSEGLPVFRGDSARWKLFQLARSFPGRPLVWVDDNPPWDGRTAALAHERVALGDDGVSLMVTPDVYTGLTQTHMDEIDAWLKLVSTPEGRAQIRAEREREVRGPQQTEAPPG